LIEHNATKYSCSAIEIAMIGKPSLSDAWPSLVFKYRKFYEMNREFWPAPMDKEIRIMLLLFFAEVGQREDFEKWD
jgi:hypothetical protein